MLEKPISGQLRNFFQSTFFLKQMCRARNDDQLLTAAHLTHGLLVQINHDLIISANNQKRRRLDEGKKMSRKIDPPSASNDGGVPIGLACGSYQCRPRPGAGAEKAQIDITGGGVATEPVCSVLKSFSKQWDVEDLTLIVRFIFSQQVQHQSCQPSLLEGSSDKAVARTPSTASAAVCECDDATWVRRQGQDGRQPSVCRGNFYVLVDQGIFKNHLPLLGVDLIASRGGHGIVVRLLFLN